MPTHMLIFALKLIKLKEIYKKFYHLKLTEFMVNGFIQLITTVKRKHNFSSADERYNQPHNHSSTPAEIKVYVHFVTYFSDSVA